MQILKIKEGQPDESIRRLLMDNVIGTPGKSLVYQHKKINEKLGHIDTPIFLSVSLGGKAIGTCCFVKRVTWSEGEGLESYYIRYFSFRSGFRSQAAIEGRLGKKSYLKKEIREVLDGKHLNAVEPHLFYAYVDPANIRSQRVIESFGFEEVGRFRTVFFSRFRPKADNMVKVLQGQELSLFKQKLKEAYIDHGLVTIDNIGFEGGCIGVLQQGKVVAALQCNAEHWLIHELPSAGLINAVSRVPWLNKLFHKEFRFLSVEGIYCENGHEHLISVLLESALKLKDRNTAILCLDPRSKVYRQVKGLNQGVIKYLTSEKEMAVVMKGNGVDAGFVRGNPVYVSGFDNM